MARHAGNEDGRRILITGLAGVLAGQLAARLEADDEVEYLAGMDRREPRHELTRTDFVRTDLRNPLVAKVIEDARIDTVVHLDVTATPGDAGGRTRMKEHNVIGTMQLLGTAQRAPRLRKVVVKSTTAVYGSSYSDPAMFREEGGPEATQNGGYGKDTVEIEGYARAFGRRRHDVALTILRFANFIGPSMHTPLTRYLTLPVVPTVLGYDPRIQLCHELDAVEVLYRSVRGDYPGIFNVAGPGIVFLSQAIRRAGRIQAPILQPFAKAVGSLVRRTARVDFSPEQLRLLMYGRVGDISRLRASFGYEPMFSTMAALDDFIASGRVTPVVDPRTVARLERGVHDLLARSAPPRETTP